MALWKVETILFTICQTTHTHYSIAARVSELVQNQVTHQFHYFTCYVKARHKKTLKKHDHVQYVLCCRHLVYSP